jgi:hypothetical protein
LPAGAQAPHSAGIGPAALKPIPRTGSDGIHRAAMRGASTHHRNRTEALARELAPGELKAEPSKAGLVATRRAVVDGWREVADLLDQQGHQDLSFAVRQFSSRMSPPYTQRERIAEQLRVVARMKRLEPPSPVR